jgi:hypothetical protein
VKVGGSRFVDTVAPPDVAPETVRHLGRVADQRGAQAEAGGGDGGQRTVTGDGRGGSVDDGVTVGG